MQVSENDIGLAQYSVYKGYERAVADLGEWVMITKNEGWGHDLVEEKYLEATGRHHEWTDLWSQYDKMW